MFRSKIERSDSLGKIAWKRFRRNKLSMFGLTIIVISVVIFVLGYLISPDASPDANEQKPELQIKKPGFSIKLLKIRKNESLHDVNIFEKMWSGKQNDYTYVTVYDYTFSGNDIVVEEYTGNEPNRGTKIRYNLADVVYDINGNMPVKNDEANGTIEFYQYTTSKKIKVNSKDMQAEIEKNLLVSKKYMLGTDRLGRDLLSRMLIGTRVSLSVGFIAVIISLFLGLLLGSISGYFRGWIDDFIMWLINVVWSIPTLLLVIAITLVLGKGFWQVFVAVGLTMWVEVARIVRGQVLSLREKEFIEAGRALGFKHYRLIMRHVLPNVMGPVIVIAASNFASAILTEASLSFLGIGAQPPTASWGKMINDHWAYIFTADALHLTFIPGVSIMIMVLAFMLVGNGLRDALDSKAIDSKPVMSNS
ncbi:MAG: ABC transporter permease [Bacteroidota bacterium]|nr:ABC transporter permease [Bacteroidota bacterium]